MVPLPLTQTQRDKPMFWKSLFCLIFTFVSILVIFVLTKNNFILNKCGGGIVVQNDTERILSNFTE